MTLPVVTRGIPGRAGCEWGSDRLDVEAYLRRVGYRGGRASTAATLRALHRAHVAAIPFENIDIVLGRAISLEIAALQDKLVGRRRGGYCYEHNLLFAALLERLGFRVTRLAGRVQPRKPGPRTHMLLVVEAEGNRWLADVGFGGGGLLEPVTLQDSVIERQGGWTYRLDQLRAGGWLLRSWATDRWHELYAFTLEPQQPIDYVVSNHFTATHPASPFVHRVVVQRTGPGLRHTFRGLRLTTARPDGRAEHDDLTTEQLPAVLRDTFGIALTPAEAALLGGAEIVPPSVRSLAGLPGAEQSA